MPGMNSGINANDPTVVAAFRAALAHQGMIALVIFILLALVWATIKTWLPADAARAAGPGAQQRTARPAEPAGRRLLRIGFGILWLFDGVLQAQPAMALGMPSKVIEPIAASSPAWVQHLVNWAGHELVLPPDPGRGLRGLDPGGHWHLADGGAERLVVPRRRAGQRGLGAGGLDLR